MTGIQKYVARAGCGAVSIVVTLLPFFGHFFARLPLARADAVMDEATSDDSAPPAAKPDLPADHAAAIAALLKAINSDKLYDLGTIPSYCRVIKDFGIARVGVERILMGMDAFDVDQTLRVLFAFGCFGHLAERAAPRVAECMTSRVQTIRVYAPQVLGDLGVADEATLASLYSGLGDGNRLVAFKSAIAICKLKRDEESIRRVIEIAHTNAESQTQIDAIEAFAKFTACAPLVVPEVKARLDARDVRIRLAAAEGLLELDQHVVAATKVLVDIMSIPGGDVNDRLRLKAANVLAEHSLHLDSVDELVKGRLTAASPHTRAHAVLILGKYIEKNEPSRLVAALSDDDWAVRMSAADALGKFIGDVSAVIPALEKATEDRTELVQWTAKTALTRIQQRKCNLVK